MNRAWIILLAFLLLIGWLIWSASRTGSVTCEACITFGGHTECAKAAAPDRDRAMMEAATVICSKLAGGMTDRIRCQNTNPDRATCEGKAVEEGGRYQDSMPPAQGGRQ